MLPLAFLNLGAQEIVILVVLAIVVWGRRLPEVAGQAAGMVQRMRRSLDDLRRETGIDREIQNARRAMDEAVPRSMRTLDVRREARKLVEEATRPAPEEPPAPPRLSPAPEAAPAPPKPSPALEEPPAPSADG